MTRYPRTLLLALLPFALTAAELKPETLAVWNDYVRTAEIHMQERLRPDAHFLWLDEKLERRMHLREGDVLVASLDGQPLKRVPFGLIHHWVGAVFIPDATLDDVLAVMRDYGRYKDMYAPNVIGAVALEQGPAEDRFVVTLVHKSTFLSTALESEYQSSYHHAGGSQRYSLGTTGRVQQIENYGRAGQRNLPADTGSGYIWRAHSISRYEAADGGIYMEVEALALSRDIPASLRWFVEPIVKQVARSALVTSLTQTRTAVLKTKPAASHVPLE